MATAPKFRIDVDIHKLLMNSNPEPVLVPPAKGETLPEPVFPRFPKKLADPPEIFIPSLLIYSSSTSATSIAGIAGHSTTKSKA